MFAFFAQTHSGDSGSRNGLLQPSQVFTIPVVFNGLALQNSTSFRPEPFQALRVAVSIREIASLVVPVGWHVVPYILKTKKRVAQREMTVFDGVLMLVQKNKYLDRPRISQLAVFDGLAWGVSAGILISIQPRVH